MNLANSSIENQEYSQAAKSAYEAMPDPIRNNLRPYSAEAELALYRSMSLMQLVRTRQHRPEIEEAVCADHSHYLAISYKNGIVRIINTKDLTEAGCVNLGETHATKLLFHPINAQVAAGTPDGFIFLIDLEGLAITLRIRAHDAPIWALSYSPNGKWIASGGRDKTVNVWNIDTGSKQAVFYSHPAPVGDLTFSPDSQLIASSSFGGNVKHPDCFTAVSYTHLTLPTKA